MTPGHRAHEEQAAGGPVAAGGALAAPSAGLDGPSALSALDLLTHLWSRPDAEELESWRDLAGLETALRLRLPSRRARLSSLVGDELLDEHERLFVGPGPVPCSPYESFWREDVPVDIRRSLMGPCTAELLLLYGELGLELDPSSGELPDHLTVELEALTEALCSQDGAAVARALFADHLRIWLPRLCRAVLHEAEHPFYAELAGTTLDWLDPLGRALVPA